MRYLGIDLARSLAMILVIIAHALMGANVEAEGSGLGALFLLFSLSPPVFFCLFGCMLQLVYARQYADGAEAETTQKLLTRAVQCWILYMLTCAVMCVASGLPASYFVRCALLLGDTPYTDILKFYAAMLLFCPILVAVSVRVGLWPLVAACLAVQLSYPIISSLPPLSGFPGSSTLSAFLYGGRYIGHTGPSVIHGIGFVVFGMLMGRVWQLRPGREFLLSGPGWTVRIAFLGMVAGAAVLCMWTGIDLTQASERILIRNSNHPLYLLAGCISAVVFIEVLSTLRKACNIGPESFLLVFGKTSLFAFCFGSMLLYAVRLDDREAPADPTLAIWSSITAISLCVLYYYFREGKWAQSNTPWARTYRWIADDSVAQAVRFISSPMLARRRQEVDLTRVTGIV